MISLTQRVCSELLNIVMIFQGILLKVLQVDIPEKTKKFLKKSFCL